MAIQTHKEITHLVIHHSASPRSTTFDQIVAWHTTPEPEGNGWDAIGYNYVILGDGNVQVGRPLPQVGAHARPNHGRVGLCVVGNNLVEEDQWSGLQIVELLHFITAFRTVFPWVEVVGHRDIMEPGYTDCPGVNIADLL